MTDPLTAAEREHQLMVNLRRIGLTTHLADQAIAEVEDSLWLALRIEEAEQRQRRHRNHWCADCEDEVDHG